MCPVWVLKEMSRSLNTRKILTNAFRNCHFYKFSSEYLDFGYIGVLNICLSEFCLKKIVTQSHSHIFSFNANLPIGHRFEVPQFYWLSCYGSHRSILTVLNTALSQP